MTDDATDDVTDVVADVVLDADRTGRRLDVVVAELLEESRSAAAARIERGEVAVDGAVAAKSARPAVGARVVVGAPPPEPTGAAGIRPPPIRWQDEHLLVVAKPAGLVVHPGTGRPAGTLVQALAEAGVPLAPAGGPERPGIVHRLDRDTSGLMVVAKTDEAYHGLVAALQRREVERRYLALVDGALPAQRGVIDAPIGRAPRDRKRFAVVLDGKPAVTRFEVVGRGAVPIGDGGVREVSLVVCRLETGRTHQIRVHLRHAGAPIVGDPVYGGRGELAAALGLDRPFLHAARLWLLHPVGGAPLDVEAPLPVELAQAAGRAGLSVLF